MGIMLGNKKGKSEYILSCNVEIIGLLIMNVNCTISN